MDVNILCDSVGVIAVQWISIGKGVRRISTEHHGEGSMSSTSSAHARRAYGVPDTFIEGWWW